MTFPARHISVSINRPPAEVYAFAVQHANLAHWASGLSQSSVRQVGGEWFADSPMGRIKVRFEADNALGVLDHDVTLPSGETVNNPMRVVANDEGSELSFTLYRRPAMSDSGFESDAAIVAADLDRLKALLEA